MKIGFIVSMALVLMIYTGSKALQYMTIPLFTIFKNLTIIMIAFGERLYFNGSPVSSLMMVAFTLMVLSSVVAGNINYSFMKKGWSDLSSGNWTKDDSVSAIVSYSWMIANCLTTAFYALFMRAKIKQVGFKDYDTVFYNNLLSIPVLLMFSVMTELPELSLISTKYSDPQNNEEFYGLLSAILLSGISGFAISYGSSWCVRVTSSTTYR
jgi:GDP-mannose transporter